VQLPWSLPAFFMSPGLTVPGDFTVSQLRFPQRRT
jgi:hypothetical protein